MAKPKIKHTITKKEWNKKHKDFKMVGKDGIHYIMMYDDKIGTYLAPVKIVDESIDEGMFSLIDQIRDDSKNVKDFIKKVLSDRNFSDMKSDKEFIQYLGSIYESINELDLNDPIMMKLRAAQMKRNKDAAKKIDTEKQNKNAIKIKALKKKRAEVMRDMEQEAEPEGGKIADRYGKLLNRIDNDIIKLGGNPMSEEVNEGTKYKVGQQTPVGKIIGTSVWGKGSKQEWFYDVQKPGYSPKQYSEKSLDKIMGESVNEASDVEVYHKSYTHAIEAAKAYALKKGYEIEDDEMFTKVGMNSKRPSVGKTTRVSLELMKGGKPQRKMLHIQVYGMKNGYELNSYIN